MTDTELLDFMEKHYGETSFKGDHWEFDLGFLLTYGGREDLLFKGNTLREAVKLATKRLNK